MGLRKKEYKFLMASFLAGKDVSMKRRPKQVQIQGTLN